MDHSLVRSHPDTGRECLYLSPYCASHFVDMTPAESRPLLDFLHSHALRPEFQFRDRWRRGDFDIWDNRCSMHYAANDYQGQRRVMHRLYVRERPWRLSRCAARLAAIRSIPVRSAASAAVMPGDPATSISNRHSFRVRS